MRRCALYLLEVSLCWARTLLLVVEGGKVLLELRHELLLCLRSCIHCIETLVIEQTEQNESNLGAYSQCHDYQRQSRSLVLALDGRLRRSFGIDQGRRDNLAMHNHDLAKLARSGSTPVNKNSVPTDSNGIKSRRRSTKRQRAETQP